MRESDVEELTSLFFLKVNGNEKITEIKQFPSFSDSSKFKRKISGTKAKNDFIILKENKKESSLFYT